MKAVYTLFLVATFLSVAWCSPAPLLGNLMSGISSMGQNIVDSGTNAVKGAVQLGVDTTKGVASGANTVGEKSLEGAANVGKNVLGLLSFVGDSLGPLGKPIKAVEGIGNQLIGAGVDAGKKAISLSGSLPDTTSDAANKLAELISTELKDGALIGTKLAQSWIDRFLELLRRTLSLFTR